MQDPNTGADIFPPLSIFGHADPVGDDDFNKVLSGRRANAFYSMLVRDVDAWEKLFGNPAGGDDWGVRSIQTMLATVQGPITVDGKIGDQTRNATRDFQKSRGLTADGVAGGATRKVLFGAYMDALCGPNLKLDKVKDFLGPQSGRGGRQGGLSGLQRVQSAAGFFQERKRGLRSQGRQDGAQPGERTEPAGDGAAVRSRTKGQPRSWPCPRASEGVAACKKRFFPDAETRRGPQSSRREFEDTGDTFACRFYQVLSDNSPCERVKPLPTPVLDGVNPAIFFPPPEEEPVAAAPSGSALVGTTAAPKVGAPVIDPGTRTVVVQSRIRRPRAWMWI